MKQKARGRLRACMALVLAFGILFGGIYAFSEQMPAAAKSLSLSMAEKLAYANSTQYAQLKRRLALTEIQYVQSVKSIRMKEKNQKTFRWSPLLNFKFPEKPTLADEFEYQFKPLELQSGIDSIKHSLDQCIHAVNEKTALQFIEVYRLQTSIAYNEKRLEGYQKTLAKNKVRLAAGLATQTDIDTMEKKINTLTSTLAADQRSFESAKTKLSEWIGMDVNIGYTFESPFTSVELDRTVLKQLTAYTLEHDDEFYKTRLETSNGLLEMNTNYRLMLKHFGSGTMSIIDSYIDRARRGEKIDADAFKSAFNEMLERADQPWVGKKRILFIKIPKIWFKGAVDGQRYVEDEPYVLYENALEYQGLLADQKSAQKELESNVTSAYEVYVSTKNSFENLQEQSRAKETELSTSRVKNLMGELEYEDYLSVQEEYEEMQMDTLAAQAAYSEAIYSLDRITCGAVRKYMSGEDISLNTAEGGESYVVEDESEGVYYYIHSLVSDNLFELGITVSDDYEIDITDYELWVDGTQVGERTAADKTLRHLALDLEQTTRVWIRLYNDQTFVDDCEIDPSEYSGLLTIRSYRLAEGEDTLVGSYTGKADAMLGVYDLTFTMEPDETAASFNVRTADGAWLIGEEKQPVGSSFRYLSLTENSLADLVICFYDESGALLYEARLNTEDGTIHKITE